MSTIYVTCALLLIAAGISCSILYYLEQLIQAEIIRRNEPSSIYVYDLLEKGVLVRQIRHVVIILSIVGLLATGFYFFVEGSLYKGFVVEWLNLLVRWVHVVAGIMWIGASFYFIFLENNLNRTEGIRDELAGNLWAIHGGGFYFLEKYKIAPQQLPNKLHWFKYEAYFTWLSGFALLCVVYYMDAATFLIDTRVANLSSAQGILLGIGSLIVGWLLYDRMCKSLLVKNSLLFAVLGFLLLAAFAYFYAHLFSGRAAYIHLGTLMGTLMAWNVYFIIIPSQKSLVRAAVTGQPLDPSLGSKAAERSLHNNYLTLPVIFIMISNHFPSTFGHTYNWVILFVITLASAGIKHFWNLRERGVSSGYVLLVSIVALISLAIVTSPRIEKADPNARVIPFVEVQTIFVLRCTQCHSIKPTDTQWTTAPNGVMYDSPEQIKKMSDKIMLRAVLTNSMPQGNKTNMTDEERQTVRQWILQGAKIDE